MEKHERDELKDRLDRLEQQVDDLRGRRNRPVWVNAALAFLIVLFVMLMSIGLIQYFSA